MADVSMQTPNDLMVVFSNTISSGFAALQGPVNGVFALMIALVVALTGIQWALSSNREVLASGFAKVLLIGAFAYLINDWENLSLVIQSGFVDLGLRAGGGNLSRADFLNPGEVLEQGWQIVKALGETPAPVNNPLDVMGNLTDALILGLAMIGIMLAFAVLALQIIVTLLEFKIVTLGGFVLLPFGIWSKSSFLAERPLGFVVSSGLKVLALAIVVSGSRSVFDQLQPSANPDLYEALAILAASLLLAMLALFIPNLASALVTGGPALGAGSAAAGALAVGGAAAAAVAGATGLGAAAARIAGPSRAAAGAISARPPSAPGNAPPRPSNDNPPRGAPGSPSPSAGGVSEAPARWRPAPDAGPPTQGAKPDAGPAPGGPGPSEEPPHIARETEAARRDFSAALKAEHRPPQASRSGRQAALQAFFVANASRGLLPGNETSGALAPQLKDEEA
ncbi:MULTISPECIES: P-type conjugative transfer protein TrbL [unclassified Phenylobacterium]|uniref:P-type conjugative transfer protein TrbL n=1 Tax=unclassified Phenylobacterium TaxID=2640670 RepID=UPI000A9FBEBA|nr:MULTISPECIES: P-type conjugative transfer protein TrbL [unclassified Phenylobacterium]